MLSPEGSEDGDSRSVRTSSFRACIGGLVSEDVEGVLSCTLVPFEVGCRLRRPPVDCSDGLLLTLDLSSSPKAFRPSDSLSTLSAAFFAGAALRAEDGLALGAFLKNEAIELCALAPVAGRALLVAAALTIVHLAPGVCERGDGSGSAGYG